MLKVAGLVILCLENDVPFTHQGPAIGHVQQWHDAVGGTVSLQDA